MASIVQQVVDCETYGHGGAASRAPHAPPASQRVLRANPSTTSNFQPSTLAEKMIYSWIEDMAPDAELDFLNAMRRLASAVPDGIASRWALFAGSGVATHFYNALQIVLRALLGLDIVFDSCLYCEMSEEKQAHLTDQFAPRLLIRDVEGLRAASSENLARQGTRELLPFCFALDGGPPCTSRTPLSSRRSSNLHCVQEGREATGQGFGDTIAVVEAHWPQILNLEWN